jgi:hypothetical protein
MDHENVTPVSRALALFASAVVLGGCGGGSSSAPPAPQAAAPTSVVTAVAMPTPTPMSVGPAGSTKAPLVGLVSMGTQNFGSGASPDNGMREINVHPGVYVGAVINVLWSQLEPKQGVFDTSAIDAGLAAIAAYDARYPKTPVVGKLRVHVGNGTPGWVMQLPGNGAITLVNGTSGQSVVVGAFWSPAYRAAWQALQAHLAATYDTNASMREVAISSCSSITAEPFIASLDATSLAAMRAFGYSDAAATACLSGAAADYAAWTHTPLDFTFNTFRNSDGCASGSGGACLVSNPTFTTQTMQAFRWALGANGVLANHGLDVPLATDAMPVYAELSLLGGAVEFQTYGPTVSWDAVVRSALQYHPTELEIWDTTAAGGAAPLSQAQLQMYASEI